MLGNPLFFGCLWVIAAAGTAMLPMRLQRYPGLPLLLLAPALLAWIGEVHGWFWVAIGLIAFGSMFRRPLNYLGRKALGLPVELPIELQAEMRR
jgi:hypothetical protein